MRYVQWYFSISSLLETRYPITTGSCCVSLFVIGKLVTTSRSCWCTPLDLYVLAQTFPLRWVKACGTPGQPTAGHWALSNGLVAAGAGHSVVSWDTIVTGWSRPKSGQVVAISGAWGGLAQALSCISCPQQRAAVMSTRTSNCPSCLN